jgi:hypothetical protein
MSLQQTISLHKNQAMVGRTLQVLIEGQGDGLSLGRSYRDAPEIDGMVIVEGAAPIGDMVPVRITGALLYDLSGIVVARRRILRGIFPPYLFLCHPGLLPSPTILPPFAEIPGARERAEHGER